MAILNNSPSLSLNEIIAKLLNNKFLSDCVFTFDNEIRVVQAHSFLLRARSIEFEKQFKSSSDNDLKLMPISKHSYESFLEFVRFIYTDECNITQGNVLSILELAVKYRVPKLENIVNEYIIEKGLSNSSKLKVYQFCVIESYELLQSWISVDIGAQLPLLLNDRSFLEMDPDTLEEILKMDYIGTVTNPVHELNIFKALMIWISHYSSKNNIPLSERRSKFDRLIRAIRFPVIPIPELNAALREHDQLLTKSDFESFFTSTNSEVWNFNNRKVYDCKANEDNPTTNAFSTPLAAIPPVMYVKKKANAKGISNNIQPTNFKISTGDDSNTRNFSSYPFRPIDENKSKLTFAPLQTTKTGSCDYNFGYSVPPSIDESKSVFGSTKTQSVFPNYMNDPFNTRTSTANWNISTGIQSTKSGNFKTSTGDDSKIRTSTVPSPFGFCSVTTVGAIDAKAFENGSGNSATPVALSHNNPSPTVFISTELKQQPMNASITTFTPDKDLLIIGLWIKASSTTLTTITVTCYDAEVLKLHVKDRKNDIILSFGESIRILANMQCKIMIDGELGVLPSLDSIPRDVIRKDIAECLKDLEVGEKVAEIFFQIPSDN